MGRELLELPLLVESDLAQEGEIDVEAQATQQDELLSRVVVHDPPPDGLALGAGSIGEAILDEVVIQLGMKENLGHRRLLPTTAR